MQKPDGCMRLRSQTPHLCSHTLSRGGRGVMAKDTRGLWAGGSQAPWASQSWSHQSLPRLSMGLGPRCAASTAGREQAAACAEPGVTAPEKPPPPPGLTPGMLALFPDPWDHPRLCHKNTTSRLKRQNAPAAPGGSAPTVIHSQAARPAAAPRPGKQPRAKPPAGTAAIGRDRPSGSAGTAGDTPSCGLCPPAAPRCSAPGLPFNNKRSSTKTSVWRTKKMHLQ